MVSFSSINVHSKKRLLPKLSHPEISSYFFYHHLPIPLFSRNLSNLNLKLLKVLKDNFKVCSVRL